MILNGVKIRFFPLSNEVSISISSSDLVALARGDMLKDRSLLIINEEFSLGPADDVRVTIRELFLSLLSKEESRPLTGSWEILLSFFKEK